MLLKLPWLWSTFTDWISSIGENEKEREREGGRERQGERVRGREGGRERRQREIDGEGKRERK